MLKRTPEHLTSLLTTDREKLTRICAEVCYGWELETQMIEVSSYLKDGKLTMFRRDFQPLANTEKGRSQAFELAVKFDCFPLKEPPSLDLQRWYVPCSEIGADIPYREEVIHKDPQAAIVIAAILTAQQENNNGNSP